MSSLHPTRRDLVLILSVVGVLLLFMQFDLSFKSDLSVGFGSRRADDDGWETAREPAGRPAGAKGKWLTSVETGVQVAKMDAIAGMADAKVRWGEEGAVRTEVLAHAPGWTIFDQIYLHNGTWYIVTDNPSSIPLLRLMTSTGNEIWNDEDSIKGREPTEKDMKIIFPSEAKRLFGQSASRVTGTTFLCNDPPQLLAHYYHFAAELLLGMWRTYASLDPTISPSGKTHLPSPSRMLFPHTQAGKWNDYAKMNSFLSRAIFPAMSYEYQNDFLDRADTARAFLFERVVFADRAAAWRGPNFQETYRTASEAITLGASEFWWTPIRKNLLEFVGGGMNEAELVELQGISGVGMEEDLPEEEPDIVALEEEEDELLGMKSEIAEAEQAKKMAQHSGKPVITYVSRQGWGRRELKPADHEGLVKELKGLEEKYGWEVNIVSMDKISRDEQIRLSARTTIMMGLHGNGLTHLLWMNAQNPRATVIEFFYPGGFAYDYEFTARALGIKHFGIWDDQTFSAPDTPQPGYPDGFQGNEIPLNGRVVRELVEKRLLAEKAHKEEPLGEIVE